VEGESFNAATALSESPALIATFLARESVQVRVTALVPARSLSIVLALACVGCGRTSGSDADAPIAVPALRYANTSAETSPFFVAWSYLRYRSRPIPLQSQDLDGPPYRVYWYGALKPELLSFARRNPGHLYINGDEPDQACKAPAAYAEEYHTFVEALRGADSTARFSPAGFAEPNRACGCPPDEPCYHTRHFIGYAQQFWDAYVVRYGSPPPVAEWRFHDFGLDRKFDVPRWWARVDSAASWSVAHGAPMVLGGWGFINWDEPEEAFLEHMRHAMDLVRNDRRIVQAAWWSFENTKVPRFLLAADSTLTPEGRQYLVDPGVMSVAITGASEVRSAARCAWSAIVTNGIPPFVYNWRVDGVGHPDSSTALRYLNAGHDFDLRVTVTDRYGVTVTAARRIPVSRSAPRCS